jgi:hypothetical protein
MALRKRLKIHAPVCEFSRGGAKMESPAIREIEGEDSSMPKTRKTLDEQLQELRDKKEAIEKKLEAAEKRKSDSERKLDTRRKIIIGGALKAHAEIDPEFRRVMQTALQKSVAAKDRALVADLLGTGVAPSQTVPTAPGIATPDKTTAANESAPPPPIPTRVGRPGAQAPGKGPFAPG